MVAVRDVELLANLFNVFSLRLNGKGGDLRLTVGAITRYSEAVLAGVHLTLLSQISSVPGPAIIIYRGSFMNRESDTHPHVLMIETIRPSAHSQTILLLHARLFRFPLSLLGRNIVEGPGVDDQPMIAEALFVHFREDGRDGSIFSEELPPLCFEDDLRCP